jgi:hypothetical protein
MDDFSPAIADSLGQDLCLPSLNETGSGRPAAINREVAKNLGGNNFAGISIAENPLRTMPKSIGQVATELGYGAPRSANPPRAPLFPGKAAKAIAGDAPSVGNAAGGPLSEAERTQLQSLLARLIGTK